MLGSSIRGLTNGALAAVIASPGVLTIVVLASLSASLAQAQVQATPANPAKQSSSAAKPDPKAQTAMKPAAASAMAATANPTIQPPESKPLWKDLTPAQQQSLKPLAANWPSLGEAHKRKWLAMSQNYTALPVAEQQKLHSRMVQWGSLSPQQRTTARLNFAESNKLTPQDKAENWRAYQALSPDDRQKLAAKAQIATPGAAAAVKPVPLQKLANVPSTRRDVKSGDLAVNNPSVDTNTLLPRSSVPAAEPAGQKN